MEFLIFNDNEKYSTRRIITRKITAYGIMPTNFNDETGEPEDGLVWIDTLRGSYTKILPYMDAVAMINTIDILVRKEEN